MKERWFHCEIEKKRARSTSKESEENESKKTAARSMVYYDVNIHCTFMREKEYLIIP
jgi:hypothetical protein